MIKAWAHQLKAALELHKKGHLDDARQIYTEILESRPDHFDALQLLGALARQEGRFAQALDLFHQALKVNNKIAAVWNNRGVTLKSMHRFEEAVESYTSALAIDPHNAEALYNRGNALQLLGRYEDALSDYLRLLTLRPEHAEAHCSCGVALKELHHNEQALSRYNEAIRLRPDYAEAFNNRGNLLYALNRLDEALESYTQALRINPGYAEAYYNQGQTLRDLGQYSQALASYDQAIELLPQYAEAYNNRALVLQDMGSLSSAFEGFSYALKLKPQFADAIFNRGLLRLRLRQFKEGFLEYRDRWNASQFQSQPIVTSIPACQPHDIKGRVLLWAEQGLGDEVFYASLLPQILKNDTQISLSADKRLHPIFARSFPRVTLIDRLSLLDERIDHGYDSQVPIGDLGYLLGLDEDDIRKSRLPYLLADPERQAAFRTYLSPDKTRLLCGLSWQSSNATLGKNKSLALKDLQGLLQLPGLRFINLQYGKVDTDLAHTAGRLGVEIESIPGLDVTHDIDGLLALIGACDVVITTSNVTAHLAGAIGKQAAVLLPAGKGRLWYWHDQGQHNLWYPSLRLFYQQNPQDWTSTINACTQWIKSLCAAQHA